MRLSSHFTASSTTGESSSPLQSSHQASLAGISSGGSSLAGNSRHPDPSEWSIEDVMAHIQETDAGLAPYVELFKKHVCLFSLVMEFYLGPLLCSHVFSFYHVFAPVGLKQLIKIGHACLGLSCITLFFYTLP